MATTTHGPTGTAAAVRTNVNFMDYLQNQAAPSLKWQPGWLMQGTARFTRTIIARGMSPATYSAHAFVQRLPLRQRYLA